MQQSWFFSVFTFGFLVTALFACQPSNVNENIVKNNSLQSSLKTTQESHKLEKSKPKATKRLRNGQQDIIIEQMVSGALVQRPVIIHAPLKVDPQRKYPVVFALHGNGGSASNWLPQMRPFIERDGWIGVYPQGIKKSWNLGMERSKADDVAFIEKVISELQNYQNIDHERLFVIGYSNGAGMANKLAIHTNYFTAIAAIVSPLTTKNRPNLNTQPVSVLQIMGKNDALIPYNGGMSRIGHNFLSAEKSIAAWANTNGCQIKPRKSRTYSDNAKMEFFGCREGKQVVHYGASGVGHRIPRSFEGGLIKLCLQFFTDQQ